MNAYDKLYTGLKDRFTVVDNGREYSFGEFMLREAPKKNETSTSLTTARSTSLVAHHPVSHFLGYVSDKLAVKKLPVRDKTIRRFPLRTSLAALFSALIACTVIFSYGSVLLKGNSDAGTYAPATVTEQAEDEATKAADTLGFTAE